MDWRHHVRSHLPPLDVPPARELDIVEELAAQLEATYHRARANGASDDEARRAAEAEVPDWTQLAESVRRVTPPPPTTRTIGAPGAGLVRGLVGDVRDAARGLRLAPGFSAAVILTLSLGIAAVAIVYSLVDGLLLKPLPIADPDRVVLARSTSTSGDEFPVSWPDFLDWQERATSFSSLAAWRGGSMGVTGMGEPRRLMFRQVTWNLLGTLGVRPILGRDFVETDSYSTTERACLISYRMWQRDFGGDDGVIGRRILLEENPTTIVGVMPAGFDVAREEDLYIPYAPAPNTSAWFRGNHQGLAAIGRLKPGVTVEAARTEIQAIAAQLEREYPGTNTNQGAVLVPLLEVLVRQSRPALLVLVASVAAMLLIACVNIANLLLVRGAGRAQEVEVRLALGASRWVIVRQRLVESVMLAVLGGAAGIALAYGGFDAFLAVLPADLARLHEVSLNGRVLVVAFGVAALSGLLAGLVPALQAGRSRDQSLLRGHRVAGAGAPGMRTRRVLLASQLALALVLLTLGGLMARTMGNLLSIDLGFDPERILTASISLPSARYQPAAVSPFLEQLDERLAALPGVSHAAFTMSLPVQNSNWNSVFVVDDDPQPARDQLPSAAWTPVTLAYFDAIGVPQREGRAFNRGDAPTSTPVAVVNESLARRFWPDGGAIGHRIKQGFPDAKNAWLEIVGVVGDVKTQGVDQPPQMQVYMPMAQRPQPFGSIVVRTMPGATVKATTLMAAVHELDPSLPVYDIRTLDQIVDLSVGRQRLVMVLLLAFAGIAVVLAAMGIFGVTAYGVAARRHEFGVRLALGADASRVIGMVVRQELGACLAGVAIGGIAAAAAAGLVRSLLYGVAPRDPLTLGATALALLAVAALACYLPARRVTRVDPVAALRTE